MKPQGLSFASLAVCASLLASEALSADPPPAVPVVVTMARAEKLGASLQATGTVVRDRKSVV